jgi:hypothetical protein
MGLVSKLDEELSSSFSAQKLSNLALNMAHGIVYVYSQLAPANSLLGVRIFLG